MRKNLPYIAIHLSMVLSLALGLLSIGAHAADSKSKKRTTNRSDTQEKKSELRSLGQPEIQLDKNWQFVFPLKVSTGAGYQKGEGVITDSGAVLSVAAEVSPGILLKNRKLLLAVGAVYSQRNTFGFTMFQRDVEGGPAFRVRPNSKLDFGGETLVGYVDKPRWPDPYQPELVNDESTGKLLRTDRNSYFFTELEGYFKIKFHPKFSGEIYGGYNYRNNVEDPNYSEADAPTHLVPGDKDRFRGGLNFTGSTPERFWRFSLDVRLDWTRYAKTYSRDAKTGLTHAGSPDEANPLQQFRELRFRQRNSLKLVKDVLKLVLIGEYTHNKDLFEHYYTWNKVDGSIRLKWTPTSRWLFEAGYGIGYQRYSKNGYQKTESPSPLSADVDPKDVDPEKGDSHPALDNGDSIRTELRHDVDARIEMALWVTQLKLYIEGDVSKNRTNFPDYEVNVFPSSRQYTIDWDYLNFEVLGGILFEM